MDPWDPAQLQFDEADFCGVARLFPLPGLVAFPHTVQQLHIFEERYRAMMQDALEGDNLIALALLQPGWESDVGGRPPLFPVACLGKIIAHHRLPDGRFNLLLLGVRRVRLVEEIEPPIVFRRARVELLDETPGDLSDEQAADCRQRIGDAMRARVAGGPAADQVNDLLSRPAPLSVLTDLAGYTLGLEEPLKRKLLAEACAATRAHLLLEAIDEREEEGAPSDGFPPPFSIN